MLSLPPVKSNILQRAQASLTMSSDSAYPNTATHKTQR